jgi:hypothetical protein
VLLLHLPRRLLLQRGPLRTLPQCISTLRS